VGVAAAVAGLTKHALLALTLFMPESAGAPGSRKQPPTVSELRAGLAKSRLSPGYRSERSAALDRVARATPRSAQGNPRESRHQSYTP
jgi:hypothetical protein